VNIEVVFALPDHQVLVALNVDTGTTVEAAVAQSAIGDMFSSEDLSAYQAGVWGKVVERDHRLQEGDRLELYRPLQMDPRDTRRLLAASGGSMGQSRDDTTDRD
jgi:uncharacterized protein